MARWVQRVEYTPEGYVLSELSRYDIFHLQLMTCATQCHTTYFLSVSSPHLLCQERIGADPSISDRRLALSNHSPLRAMNWLGPANSLLLDGDDGIRTRSLPVPASLHPAVECCKLLMKHTAALPWTEVMLVTAKHLGTASLRYLTKEARTL